MMDSFPSREGWKAIPELRKQKLQEFKDFFKKKYSFLGIFQDSETANVNSPLPVVAKENIPSPVVAKENTPPPVVAKENTPPPVVTKENIPPPVVAKENTPPPVVAKENTPSPVVAEENTPSPVVAKENTPIPVVAKENTPLTVAATPGVCTASTPPTASTTVTKNKAAKKNAPRPVIVMSPAVSIHTATGKNGTKNFTPSHGILGKRLRSVSLENILQTSKDLAAPSSKKKPEPGPSSSLRTRVLEAFYAKRTPPVPVVVAEVKSFIPGKDTKKENAVSRAEEQRRKRAKEAEERNRRMKERMAAAEARRKQEAEAQKKKLKQTENRLQEQRQKKAMEAEKRKKILDERLLAAEERRKQAQQKKMKQIVEGGKKTAAIVVQQKKEAEEKRLKKVYPTAKVEKEKGEGKDGEMYRRIEKLMSTPKNSPKPVDNKTISKDDTPPPTTATTPGAPITKDVASKDDAPSPTPTTAASPTTTADPTTASGQTQNRETYDITMDPLENYDIGDLSSEDSTDDEECPKKPIPQWVHPSNLGSHLKKQEEAVKQKEYSISEIFPPDELLKDCNLNKIFRFKRKRFYHRTSSAIWSTPNHIKM